MTFDPTPYAIGLALVHWLIVFGSCLGVVLLVALLTSLGVSGAKGPANVGNQIGSGLTDWLHIAARRVWALTMLTYREAIRRKALLVFVVFAVLFMFAGWFLSASNDRPELQVKVYVSFVLTAVSWLILPVVLLLACWGLPEDIKARSLHTVVTKPARRNEVVLGRILGFTIVGSLVLFIMGGVGYVWIKRQITTPEAQQRLVCRVPVYGTLNYLTREGIPGQGINVGDIWEYREYIEGATKARAIWEFNGVGPDHLYDGRLRLEARFEAFRTHKGTMGKRLFVQYEFVNEQKRLRIPYPAFEVNEYGENITEVDSEWTYTDKESQELRTAKLFEDIVQDGKLRIEVMCLDPGQYLGMARPDLFIRTPDKPFASGFFKALAGVWLMMVLIVVLGVTASCFVKGPVATLLTATLIVVGQGFREFMGKIVGGGWEGGGPVESVIRIYKHLNPKVPLTDALGSEIATSIVQGIDGVMIHGLWLVQQIIPNFDYYRMSPYVANGFDVGWNSALLPSIAITLAYLLPCLLIGHYSLKLRELEAK